MDYKISIFIWAYHSLRGIAIIEGKNGINFIFKRVINGNKLICALMFSELFHCHN